MVNLKRDFFIIVCLLIIVALTLILSVAILTDGTSGKARPTNYTGIAGLVLEIVNKTNSAMPGYENVTIYNVNVLYSNDSAIKDRMEYCLEIDEHATGYFGTVIGIAPKELAQGSIIGIDYYDLENKDNIPWIEPLYQFNESKITVTVEADPRDNYAWDNAWRQKIGIIE